MSKDKTKYEIHVNAYEIGDNLEKELLSFGFYLDNFDRSIITTHAPPHHFTYRTYENKAHLNEVWNMSLQTIKDDNKFKGYIEAETVPEIYRMKFEEKIFSPLAEFPFKKCEEPLILIPGDHKASDIHIERDLNLPRDQLDELLLNHNFYEVHWKGQNEAERIFTYQTQWFADAKKVYGLLANYLQKVSGVRQLDLEITSMYFRKPFDFPVAKVIPKGFFL